MELAWSAEREELRDAVRSFLTALSPETEVRRLMDTADGYDPAIWRRFATELGATSLTIPEEYGGAGGTFAEVGAVMEELGRTLAPLPYFSTAVLATSALLLCDDESARKDYLPGIAAGGAIATLALAEESASWDAAGIHTAARPAEDGWELTGTKLFVLDGCAADLILVAARTAAGTRDGSGGTAGDGVSLFAVQGTAPGLRRTAMATLDRTRRQARLDLAEVPAKLVGPEGGAWPPLERVLQLAAVGLACEQVGGAERTLEMATSYAKTRVQFGRPIGSFQAIKHRCADMALDLDDARHALTYGLWAAVTPDAELPLAAAIAKVRCSEAYVFAAAENIQVHGGIGFTWEHPAHLYLRRATTDALLFGDPVHHREQLIRLLTAV